MRSLACDTSGTSSRNKDRRVWSRCPDTDDANHPVTDDVADAVPTEMPNASETVGPTK